MSWLVVEMVITCCLGRLLMIWLGSAGIEVEIGFERTSGTIVEIVLRVEAMIAIVISTKVFYALGLAERSILTSDMIGNKVDDDSKTRLASPRQQCLKL